MLKLATLVPPFKPKALHTAHVAVTGVKLGQTADIFLTLVYSTPPKLLFFATVKLALVQLAVHTVGSRRSDFQEIEQPFYLGEKAEGFFCFLFVCLSYPLSPNGYERDIRIS